VSVEHTYIVVYDIADARRWRVVFRLMNGFGEWAQLSVFQCRLTRARALELESQLMQAIDATQDHVMIVDLGPSDSVSPKITSLGKRGFEPIERKPFIV
jgi:CRISPR-associated protein Cas2